ncbi:hypothetical protein GJV26_04195 [Massilia dura]|uniref:Uncharacterized protein n=1 Tax=Pseudoduganella dura TaxID=321982 RepID=A0A6I3X637_9BURK|nr:hypothetical protein [Pseudoduganella dura]MUI11687.1 hypothetical protein [Pseudoduganella dura]GGX78346.1 hypothetical protein GCM10007386_06650 [Pseudoduganella dura]
MPSQSYRGHVIDVTSYPLGERIAYLSSITVVVSGEVRHLAKSLADSFTSDSDAQDYAFSEARSWVERFPLRWPFTARAASGT